MDKPVAIAGTGSSQALAARDAGASAARLALDRLVEAARGSTGSASSPEPALVVVHASVAYDLEAVLQGVFSVVGEAPIVGCTTAGQIESGTYLPAGSGVAVLLMTAGPYRFGIASIDGLGAGDTEAAGRALAMAARAAVGVDRPPEAAILLFSDGMVGQQQDLLTGIYRVAGAGVPVVGGAAGDDFAFRETFVFHGDRVLRKGAVAVWIASDRPFRVVARHGYRPISLPLMVTQVDGLAVHNIAGRAALERYREALGDDGTLLRPSVYSVLAQEHPFGLLQPDGSHLIRVVRTADNETDLMTFTEIPEFSAINVMAGRPDDLLAVAAPVVGEALAGRDAAVLLLFSCAARRESLGDRVCEEAALLQQAAGAVPTFGFYTYGEFARTRSVAGVHNATIAGLAL